MCIYYTLACVASVSVWFRGKEIPRKGTFGFDRARNETRTNRPSAPKHTQKNYFTFTNASSKVHFRSTEGQTFYWSIMTVDNSIKCRFVNSGVTDQVGGFQNPGVCLQAFPSFLPHPLPALLLAPLFSRSLTLVPRSFLLNRTETLATQATRSMPTQRYFRS